MNLTKYINQKGLNVMFYQLTMFLQIHFLLFYSLWFFFLILFLALVLVIAVQFAMGRKILYLFGSVIFSFVVLLFLGMSTFWSDNSSKIASSISTWSKPVTVRKLVSDEVNTDAFSNSSKLRYVVTDHHVYTLRHHDLIETNVKTTSKPTYMTYQDRVLKPDATNFERQYFKLAKNHEIKTYGHHIKLGKLVKYVNRNQIERQDR